MNMNSLLDRLMPDVSDCRRAAEALIAGHPGWPPVELARLAVSGAKIKAAATGAITGAAASPITMLPAALADAAAVLRIEATLVGTIAALYQPALLDDPTHLKADILGIVFPAAVSQALRQAGIQAGERLSQVVIRKYIGEELLGSITRIVSRYMGKQLTRGAVVRKTVPLVGMGIGAGWNWLEVRVIGTRAVGYYSGDTIGSAPGHVRKLLTPTLKRFWPTARSPQRLLPPPKDV